jgi:hypothetical protein
MKTTDTNSEICNSLLRGELSAIETYTQAIEKFADHLDESPLNRIRSDHEAAAESLREIIGESEEKFATSSGSWGTFATAVEGAATLFGESPALTILQQGEEHGISEYEDALAGNDLDEPAMRLIRDKLLPAQRNHIAALKQYKSEAV